MNYHVYLDIVRPGCLPNLVGCSKIHQFLMTNGHTLTSDPHSADFIIISTCGFNNDSQENSLNHFKHHQVEKKETTRIIIYGCLVDINPGSFSSSDAILIGLHDTKTLDSLFYRTVHFQDVATLCRDELKEQFTDDSKSHLWHVGPFLLTKILTLFSSKIKKRHDTILKAIARKQRDFVQISQGCTGKCSYCVIKKARGNLRSRPLEDILHDITCIASPDHSLFLVADDCGSYGLDIGTNLFELLYTIKQRHPNLPLDINYLNPQWLIASPEEYVDLFSDIEIKSVIIPIQSGSQQVIERMNRSYDIQKTLSFIHRIRQVSPDTVLYGHFILGFPGETFRDYLKSLFAVRYFDYPVSFMYSDTKGAESVNLPHKVPSSKIVLRWALFFAVINMTIALRIVRQAHSTPVKILKNEK
jgi:threonylcarbamoyladenosine tRNA methylthiotransferase CDKAL1